MDTYTQKLSKLEALVKMVDEGVTKDEFVKSFENVVNLVKQIQKGNEQEFSLMQENFRLLGEKLKERNASELAGIKKELNDLVSKQIKNLQTAYEVTVRQVEGKLSTVRNGMDGKDGRDADEGRIIKVVLSKIPAPDIQPLWDRLEEVKKEMDDKIKAIPERPTMTIFGPGKTKIATLDLSSKLDGVTKSFYIGDHFGIIAVDSSSAPFGAFRPTIDYKEVGQSIEFTSVVDAATMLATGQSLIIRYLW